MTPIEATVRLIENWSVTGKLSDLNVGQTLDLTESVFNLFNQKPKPVRKTPEKATEPAKPVHVVMEDDPFK